MPFSSTLRYLGGPCVLVCMLAAQTDSYQAAVELVKAGNFDKAIPLLQATVEASPSDLRSRNLLGIALSGAGRREEANEQFFELLKKNPTFVPALKNLAHNELALGRLADARQHFNAALRFGLSDPSVYFGLANTSFLERDYATAISHFEKTKGLYLKEPLALVRYAWSCAEQGLRDKALETLNALPVEGVPAVQSDAGLVYTKLGQYPQAVARFKVAHETTTDANKTGFNLALAYLKTGDHANAAKVAEQIIAQGHPTAEIHSLLADAYEAGGRTKEAYEELRAAIRLEPKDERAYVRMIALCLDHENPELALQIADLGVTAQPSSLRMRVQRGIVHALAGRSQEALADFRAAIKTDPEASLGYVAEGLILTRMDRNEEAIEALKARLKKQPNDALANWMLAEALLKAGLESTREAEAIAALERSVAANGRVPQSRSLLGKLLLAKGEVDRAQQELEAALKLDAANVSAAYVLGQVYRKQGKTAEADRLFAEVAKAKSEDPNQSQAKALLRIVQERQ